MLTGVHSLGKGWVGFGGFHPNSLRPVLAPLGTVDDHQKWGPAGRKLLPLKPGLPHGSGSFQANSLGPCPNSRGHCVRLPEDTVYLKNIFKERALAHRTTDCKLCRCLSDGSGQ